VLIRERFTSGGEILLRPLLINFLDRHDHLLSYGEKLVQPSDFVSFWHFSFFPALSMEHKQRKKTEKGTAVCTTLEADLPL